MVPDCGSEALRELAHVSYTDEESADDGLRLWSQSKRRTGRARSAASTAGRGCEHQIPLLLDPDTPQDRGLTQTRWRG